MTTTTNVRGEYIFSDKTDRNADRDMFAETRYQVRVGNVAVTADQPHLRGAVARLPGMAVRLGIDTSQVRCLPG